MTWGDAAVLVALIFFAMEGPERIGALLREIAPLLWPHRVSAAKIAEAIAVHERVRTEAEKARDAMRPLCHDARCPGVHRKGHRCHNLDCKEHHGRGTA